jgi:hypothetical protein
MSLYGIIYVSLILVAGICAILFNILEFKRKRFSLSLPEKGVRVYWHGIFDKYMAESTIFGDLSYMHKNYKKALQELQYLIEEREEKIKGMGAKFYVKEEVRIRKDVGIAKRYLGRKAVIESIVYWSTIDSFSYRIRVKDRKSLFCLCEKELEKIKDMEDL